MHSILLKKILQGSIYIFALLGIMLGIYGFLYNANTGARLSSINLVYALNGEEDKLVQPYELGANDIRFSTKTKFSEVKYDASNYDYRAHIFDSYFRQYDSPLVGYGQVFVDACEKYGAPDDCLLMVAIAKAETNLCKTGISDQQKNCWGFGGSGENRIEWPTYEVGINEVTRRVMSGYGTPFFEDAHNGSRYYCGAHCGDKWPNIVNDYKAQINKFGMNLGYPSLL